MSGILEKARFGADGLIPAVVQDAHTREVLTVAYMNKEALQLTLEKKETHFWSRSRQQLWHKGETSGNFQKVRKSVWTATMTRYWSKSNPWDRRATPVRIPVLEWNLNWKASYRNCTRVIEERKERAAGRKLHDLSLQQWIGQDPEEGRRRGDGNGYRGEKR